MRRVRTYPKWLTKSAQMSRLNGPNTLSTPMGLTKTSWNCPNFQIPPGRPQIEGSSKGVRTSSMSVSDTHVPPKTVLEPIFFSQCIYPPWLYICAPRYRSRLTPSNVVQALLNPLESMHALPDVAVVRPEFSRRPDILHPTDVGRTPHPTNVCTNVITQRLMFSLQAKLLRATRT